MIELWIALTILVVVAILVVAYWRYASRLDRLHRKVEASKIGLEAQLVSRCNAVIDLALAGNMNPASAFALAQAAYETRDQREFDSAGITGAETAELLGGLLTGPRCRVESSLTQVLREALTEPEQVANGNSGTDELEPVDVVLDDHVDAVIETWYRVQLARRFHNEAVAQTQSVRNKRIIRWLRMAGSAPLPNPVDFDDAMPPTLLGRRSQRASSNT